MVTLFENFLKIHRFECLFGPWYLADGQRSRVTGRRGAISTVSAAAEVANIVPEAVLCTEGITIEYIMDNIL